MKKAIVRLIVLVGLIFIAALLPTDCHKAYGQDLVLDQIIDNHQEGDDTYFYLDEENQLGTFLLPDVGEGDDPVPLPGDGSGVIGRTPEEGLLRALLELRQIKAEREGAQQETEAMIYGLGLGLVVVLIAVIGGLWLGGKSSGED